jgi:hypothetical protein
MANNLTNFEEDRILNHITGRTDYNLPTNLYLGLFTAAPGEAGGGTEVSGGGYARQQTVGKWAAASGGSISTNADVDFGTASGAWGTVTHVALFDASAAGNMVWHGALASSKTVASGDGFKVSSGQLTLALD